jgi:hypothetical protein
MQPHRRKVGCQLPLLDLEEAVGDGGRGLEGRLGRLGGVQDALVGALHPLTGALGLPGGAQRGQLRPLDQPVDGIDMVAHPLGRLPTRPAR